MKKILFIFLIFCQSINAQWSQTKGPFSGLVSTVVKSDTTLFAGTYNGIFRSLDGGNTWQELTNGLPNQFGPIGWANEMIVSNSGIYASFGQVYKSIDNGDNWNNISPLPGSNPITCFDTIGKDILAGSSVDGVYISNDSAIAWTLINNGLTTLKINALAHLDSIIIAGTWNAGIFISLDYGNNWSAANNGISDTLINDLHVIGSKILAVTDHNIYVSVDTGNSWTIVYSNFCPAGTFAQDGSTIYVASGANCSTMFSNDSGLTWTSIDNYLINGGTAVDSWDGIIYGCTGNYGVVISSDHGLTWNRRNNGIIRSDCFSFVDNGSELWNCASGGIYKTSDEGLSWDSVLNNSITIQGSFLFKYGNYIFTCTNDGIMRTSDNGNTWSLVYPAIVNSIAIHNGNLYSSFSTNVIVSSDSGNTWNSISTFNIGFPKLFASKDTSLYMATSDGIYISSNNGSSWTSISNGLPAIPEIEKLYMLDSTLYCIESYKIYRYDRINATWSIKDFGIELIQMYSLLINGAEIYATSNGGVFVSLNNGDSWSPINESLFFYALFSSDICIYKNNLYLATGFGGVWKHPLLNSIISGRIYNDLNNNCLIDTGEAGLAKFAHSFWIAKASKAGVDYFGVPDTNGYYSIKADIGNYNVTLVNPAAVYSVTCPPSQNYNVTFVSATDSIDSVDFALQPQLMCSMMKTSISSTIFRPCLNSTIYVDYCNEGTVAEQNAILTVNLAPEFTVINSSTPWDTVNGNSYSYNIGLVQPGSCGTIVITASVLCDPTALLNATLCVRSEVSPEEFCVPGTTWDHSSVIVDGRCNGDTSVCFSIENTGSDMLGFSQWRFYVDNILTLQGTFHLLENLDTSLCFTATGQTFRLEADQSPNHPGTSVANLSIERCGILGPFQSYSLGQILTAPVTNGLPYVSEYCALVRSSFDPNEKHVVPAGLGSNHIISKNDRLEYKIDFQNTGNDTAFSVVVKDPIDVSVLDISSIDIGTCSHNFSFSIESPNILVWRFENIYLPDSNINESLSHGFINFSIGQLPNLSSGTQIINTADIYFDFNTAVATNSVTNTVCIKTPPLISYDGNQLLTTPASIYQWYLFGTPIPGAINQAFTPIYNGQYTVEIIDGDGCISLSDTFSVLTISVPEISNKYLTANLYPNPAGNSTLLTVKPDVSGKMRISLIGTDGKEQLNIERLIEGNQKFELPIETSHLHSGVYFLRLTLRDKHFYLKLLVIK